MKPDANVSPAAPVTGRPGTHEFPPETDIGGRVPPVSGVGRGPTGHGQEDTFRGGGQTYTGVTGCI